MEAVCTLAMILMALCSPMQGSGPREHPRANTPTFTRVSPSTSILGRQLAVAPAGPSTPAQGFAASLPWGDPRRLAYCGADGIESSLDGGQTWRHIPTDGVEQLAAQTDLPLAPRLASSPGCQSVTLDPSASDTFYAVFAAVTRPQDAPPPWFAVGYVTRDAGQSWRPVPVPEGAPTAPFGGFTVETGTVQALFVPPDVQRGPGRRDASAAAGVPVTVPPPLVLQTTDGGETWKGAGLGCPASGPCIRWGVPPTGIGSCAMHGYGQPLLVSADGGRSWQTPVGATGANACRPNELVVIADQEILLLAPGGSEIDPGAAPVRISHDGGLTFEEHPLPENPAGPLPGDLFELYVLPDERLLARVSGQIPGPGWHWQLLGPSAEPPAPERDSRDRWCTVSPSAGLPQTGMPLRVAGSRIWWLADDSKAESRSLADLQCDGAGVLAPAAPTATPTPPAP